MTPRIQISQQLVVGISFLCRIYQANYFSHNHFLYKHSLNKKPVQDI